MQNDAFVEKSVTLQGMCGPVCQNGALCPSGSARFCLLPKRQPDGRAACFAAKRLSTVLRVGSHASAARDGFTSAHEKIGKSGVLSVDGPRGKLSGRRKRKSAKSRRCEAGRPARELPSGGECRPMGNAVRRRFSQAQHGRRQANFVEIRRLKGKLSTYPHGYPQCRRFMP